MKLHLNYSLQNLNAFRVKVKAKYFAEVLTQISLRKLLADNKFKRENKYVLGDGTNTLFTKNYNGLILKSLIKGRSKIKENSSHVFLEVGGGENWHELVLYTVNRGWSGLENMSLIPGTVGAAPVQNIAAYGQNFEDIFSSLEAINIKTGAKVQFNKNECKFGYRDSIFKHKNTGKYFITKVRLILNKQSKVDISYHSRYDSLESELTKFTKPPYSIKDISKAVTSIRTRKLPDIQKYGTAGSFFLNPVISKKKLLKLQKVVPEVQYYPVNKLTYLEPGDTQLIKDNYVKVAAGWLLEELGWKGKRIGNVGTSSNQSLIVINCGGATAKEIIKFTNLMREDFKKAYGIKLESEVNII